MAITVLADVRSGFLGDTSDEDYILGLIERAERKLIPRLGDLEVWAGGARLPVTSEQRIQAIKDVVSEMVQRVLRTGGSPMKTESDSGYSYTLDPTAAAASLWVTDANWEQLLPTTGTQVGTIRVGIPSWSGRSTW